MRRWVFIFLVLIGAALCLYGAVSDPFSIPFQDFDELPAEVKEQYFEEARLASYLRYGGGALMVVSLVALVLSFRR